jgi:DnaK suppressor protein
MHIEKYRIELERAEEYLKRNLLQRHQIAIQRSPDQVEDMVFAAERESAIIDLERTSRQLRQVEVALSRIRAGTYGACLKCDEPISEKRLRAVPWAVYCIGCQEEADRLRARMDLLRKFAA